MSKRTSQSGIIVSQSHAGKFSKVLDGRKQPIRGLWVRNGRYYAQLSFEDANTGQKQTRRVPLTNKDGEPVGTAAQAAAELGRLKAKRSDNDLPVLRRTPKFTDFADNYLAAIEAGHGMKKRSTVAKERAMLVGWKKRIGGLRVDQIKRAHVNSFVDGLVSAKLKPRTVNLNVIAFRNVMKRAVEDGWIPRLPTEGMRPLKVTTPKRELFGRAELDRLCKAAFETRENEEGERVPVTKNAQQFVDYIRFMAYTGTRRNEALAMRWSDINFAQEQLTIGAEGDTKNRTARVLDFNTNLRGLLLDMQSRRAPDSDWLFPSPQRGEKDIHTQTFRESLHQVRLKAGLPKFTFHDCRHHFISMCVMSGIDFMTIAAWVGHRDGGVLIGKVYGHLANEHRKLMAERLNFGPRVLDQANSA